MKRDPLLYLILVLVIMPQAHHLVGTYPVLAFFHYAIAFAFLVAWARGNGE